MPILCPFSLGNTGTGCTPIADETDMLIFEPAFDSDGDENLLDLADTLNQVFFDALINQSDVSKRWYPTPLIKNPEDTRGESVVQEFNDGSKIFIREGTRHFVAMIPKSDATPQLVGKLNKIRESNAEIGVWYVDKLKQLIGALASEGFMRGVRIIAASFNATIVKATGGNAAQMIMIEFDVETTEKDSDLRIITREEMDDIDLTKLRGLLDIMSTYSDITLSGFKATLKTVYGTPITPILDVGLLAANFSLFNVTTSLAVTISGITESPDGTYAFTFAAQSNGDQLRLTPSKAGRDYTDVIANLIDLPT